MALYMVVENDRVSQLIKNVNEKTKQGWEPIGGVSVVRYESYETALLYCQAMRKKSIVEIVSSLSVKMFWLFAHITIIVAILAK